MYRQERLRSNYTAGDYYRGGYYPAGGFLSGLKKIGGGLLKAAAPALSAAFPGAAAAIGIAKGLAQGIGSPTSGGSMLPAGPVHAAALAKLEAKAGGKVISFSGGGGGGGYLPAHTGVDASGIPKGHHLSKKTGKIVRNRHMNPLNPRALRRGMHRVQSFARFARKTISFTHRVKMKKHRRK